MIYPTPTLLEATKIFFESVDYLYLDPSSYLIWLVFTFILLYLLFTKPL